MSHLFVAIPTHSETLTTVTAGTVFSLQRRLVERGDRIDLHFYSSAVIAELRNIMLRDFMSTSADALLMIDADQGAPAELLLKLIDSGHLVCGCLYPRRAYHWDQVPRDLGTRDMAAVLQRASSFVGQLDATVDSPLHYIDGFAPAVHVGAGVLLIRREAVTLLQARFPELEGLGLPPDDARGQGPKVWGFFNPMQIDARYGPIQEDYAFCHRWRVGCGQTLWAEIATPVAHVGRAVHEGSFLDFARAHGDAVQPGDHGGSQEPMPPTPRPGELLGAGRADRAWQALFDDGPVQADDIPRAQLAAEIAEQRCDWSTAAALRNLLASATSDAINPKLALMQAVTRCGGLAEARAIARMIAREHSGPERLRGVAMLAESYAAIDRLRDRATRLAAWVERQGGSPSHPTISLAQAASLRLANDIETRALGGDVAGALASAERWLSGVDSRAVENARARMLIEACRMEDALALLDARVGDGGGDWRTLMLTAWAAGEAGRLTDYMGRLAAAAPAIASDEEARQAYAFVRACAAYGAGREAAAIVADGIDPLVQPGWLAGYLGKDAPEASWRRFKELSGRIAEPVLQAPSSGPPVHVLTTFGSAVGGSEGHALELAQALRSRTTAHCWSLGPMAEHWSARGVLPLPDRPAAELRGGTLAIVGTWFPLDFRVAELNPERVVIVYNTFHAPGLERMVEDVARGFGLKPELMFVSPLMHEELDLPGSVFPSMTDLRPYLAIERRNDRGGCTIGRLSRDTADKQRLGDVEILKSLLALGARVDLVGASFLARGIGAHPNLSVRRTQPGIAAEYLAELDVFFYRTGLWVEPCARVVLEAMASGLPVVIDADSGIGAYLTDGEDAVLVRSDAEALERLIELNERQELRRRIGEAARERAARLLSGAGLGALLDVFAAPVG